MVVVYFPALKFFKTGSPEQPLRNPKTFSSILKTSQEFLTNSQGGERDSYQTDSYQNDNQTWWWFCNINKDKMTRTTTITDGNHGSDNRR